MFDSLAKIMRMKNHLLVIRTERIEHVYCCILVNIPLSLHDRRAGKAIILHFKRHMI